MPDTGLKQKDVIGHVLNQVWLIRESWLAEGTGPQSRMRLLVYCAFKGLDMLGIPHPEVRYDPNFYRDTGNTGEYQGNDWTLVLDSSFATPEKVREQGDLALRECLDTVYHETRHHEQHYRARYYWLTAGKAWANFKANLEGFAFNKKQGMPMTESIPQNTARNFGIPLKYAEAFCRMRGAQFQYRGVELDETLKWYEEFFGVHKADRGAIMDALPRHRGRDSIYAMYRTIFMEDDGWETGYRAGDAYLVRCLNEKKATREQTIQETERKYQLLRENHVKKQNNLLEDFNKYKTEGGQALLNRIKQKNEELKLEAQKLKNVEDLINGQKNALANMDNDTVKLVKSHRQSMSEHRLKAYSSRQRHGLYAGTASPS